MLDLWNLRVNRDLLPFFPFLGDLFKHLGMTSQKEHEQLNINHIKRQFWKGYVTMWNLNPRKIVTIQI